jgi:hypothetical protein
MGQGGGNDQCKDPRIQETTKTIPIPERVKGTQELKKLHTKLLTTQTQKQERQAQIEPLQERITTVLEQAEEARTLVNTDSARMCRTDK